VDFISGIVGRIHNCSHDCRVGSSIITAASPIPSSSPSISWYENELSCSCGSNCCNRLVGGDSPQFSLHAVGFIHESKDNFVVVEEQSCQFGPEVCEVCNGDRRSSDDIIVVSCIIVWIQ